MKIFKKVVAAMSSIAIIGTMLGFGVAAQEDLLGYNDNGQLLGVASSFSVFLEEDFAADGSDCEGRIAVGGGANLGAMDGYSVGIKNENGADVIVEDGPLTNFTTGDRIFVVENKGAEIGISGDIRYEDLIDFNKEFNILREISLSLAENETGSYSIDPYWTAQINFVGAEEDYNYFTLSAAEITTHEHHFNFDVPADSYVVVNILDKEVDLYTQLYDCQISGERITSNDDEKNCRIIYNLPYAETVTLNGNGRFHGSILAPNANVTGPETDGAHLSGQLIAKSYSGAMEFGALVFGGKEISQNITTEPTTTTTETTTTTTTETTTTAEITTTTTSTTTEITTELITTTTETTTTELTMTTTETTAALSVEPIITTETILTTSLAASDGAETTTSTEIIEITTKISDISNTTIQNAPDTGDNIYMVFLICFVAALAACFCLSIKED